MSLFEKGDTGERETMMAVDEWRIQLIGYLLSERGDGPHSIPEGVGEQRALLRALMNVRPPAPVPEEILKVQDAYLAARLAERGGAVDARALRPADPSDAILSRIALWRGDITLLSADAIVNAANSQMLGCFVPGHHCIDNAIHSFAGIELRLSCADLMRAQGHEEPTGQVKVTPAYNLPARYVLHTVGPIVQGGVPTPHDRGLLASCYRACLAEATRRGLGTLAFCCISTGLFGFPREEAARIAVNAARAHLAQTDSQLKVVFDVFSDRDERIYRELLS